MAPTRDKNCVDCEMQRQDGGPVCMFGTSPGSCNNCNAKMDIPGMDESAPGNHEEFLNTTFKDSLSSRVVQGCFEAVSKDILEVTTTANTTETIELGDNVLPWNDISFRDKMDGFVSRYFSSAIRIKHVPYVIATSTTIALIENAILIWGYFGLLVANQSADVEDELARTGLSFKLVVTTLFRINDLIASILDAIKREVGNYAELLSSLQTKQASTTDDKKRRGRLLGVLAATGLLRIKLKNTHKGLSDGSLTTIWGDEKFRTLLNDRIHATLRTFGTILESNSIRCNKKWSMLLEGDDLDKTFHNPRINAASVSIRREVTGPDIGYSPLNTEIAMANTPGSESTSVSLDEDPFGSSNSAYALPNMPFSLSPSQLISDQQVPRFMPSLPGQENFSYLGTQFLSQIDQEHGSHATFTTSANQNVNTHTDQHTPPLNQQDDIAHFGAHLDTGPMQFWDDSNFQMPVSSTMNYNSYGSQNPKVQQDFADLHNHFDPVQAPRYDQSYLDPTNGMLQYHTNNQEIQVNPTLMLRVPGMSYDIQGGMEQIFHVPSLSRSETLNGPSDIMYLGGPFLPDPSTPPLFVNFAGCLSPRDRHQFF